MREVLSTSSLTTQRGVAKRGFVEHRRDIMADLRVGGKWKAHQDNGFDVIFDIQQSGPQLTGSASHSDGTVKGDGKGLVVGDSFDFTVQWNNDTRGRYTATLDSNGRLQGETVDEQNPGSQRARWASVGTFSFVG
jgi:hypothetical protein